MNEIQENSKIFHTRSSGYVSISMPKIIIILSVFVLLGIATGYLLATKRSSTVSVPAQQMGNSTTITVGTTYGTNDTNTFKDTTEGTLAVGGVSNEGQYHLVRSGGDSQNVYLISSTVDLSKFVGHKIKIWGQTQKAHTAGWLMDVGKVEVLN